MCTFVSHPRGLKRLGIKGKLAPHYIGPFLVLAYHLELPPTLAGVHNVFYISQLKKCFGPPMDVVVDDVSPLHVDLSYPVHPMKILDRQDRDTRRRSSKVSGAVIPNKRLHGKPRNFFVLSIYGVFPHSDAHVTSFV
jgi:hypothetical protein